MPAFSSRNAPSPPLLNRLALNALSYTGVRIITGVGNLVIWPFVILRIGFTIYGAWVLVAGAVGYLGLLDLSLGTAYVRLVADRTHARHAYLVNLGASSVAGYNLVLSILAAVVFIPPAEWYGKHIFHIRGDMLVTWRWLVVAGCLLFLVNSLGSVLSLALNGLQFISELSIITLGSWLVGVVAALFSLALGFGVWSVVIGSVTTSLISAAAAWILLRRKLPTFRFNLFPRDMSFYRDNFRFSFGVQLTRLVDVINGELDAVLSGAVSGARFVAYYNTGMTLASVPRDLSSGIVTAYFPEARARLATGDFEGAHRLYWRTLRVLLLGNGFLAGGVAACAWYFVPVWYHGYDVPFAALVATLMTVAIAAHQVTSPGTNYLWALGKSGWASLYGVIGAIINVGFTVPLALRFGFVGIVWGSSIGLTAGSCIFFVYFHRLFVPGGRQARDLITKIIVTTVAASALAHLAAAYIPTSGGVVAGNIERFLVAGTLYSALFVTMALATALIDHGSVSLFGVRMRGAVKLAKGRMTHVDRTEGPH